jgi:WD40 repeat protein
MSDAETQGQLTFDEGVILFSIAISPDERLLAVGGEDGMIRMRDATSGRLITKLRGHAGGIRELAFSFDGRWLVSGGERGEVRQWRMTDELAFRSDAFAPQLDVTPAQRILDISTVETFDLAFHPTRPLLAISSDKLVKFWDLARNQFQRPIEMDATIRSIDFSPDGRCIFVGTWSTPQQHGTRVFDVATCDLTTEGRESFDANVAMLSHDGRYVVLSRDHHAGAKIADISVFDTEANKVCLELVSNEQYQFGYGVDRSALSPDNSILAVYAREGDSDASTIQAWNLRTKQRLWTKHAHDEPIHCLEFSPNGKLLVSTSDDHTMRFWEPASGKLLRTLKGHRSWVMEAVFSPDGKTLATASVDGTVRLWDVATGNERFVFRGDGSPFISIGMSREGNVIAAGNLHGKVFLWHANKHLF